MQYSRFLTSRQEIKDDKRPATTTGCIRALSLWNGLTVRVPLPRCVRPWANLTINRLLASLLW